MKARDVNQRFPRGSRLLKAEQFGKVFSQGKKRRTQVLVIFFLENNLSHARLGFAISKRRLRGAVQRNRVKRVLRECFRRHRPRPPALDIVVTAAAGLEAVDNARITAEFEAFLRLQCEKYLLV